MNDTNEGRIRQYVDQQGGSAQVPFHNLMTTWRVQYPTEADCRHIEEALRGVGVTVQPSLAGLSPDSYVWLQATQVQAQPPQQQQPHQGPPTPYGGPPPPAPAPQAPPTPYGGPPPAQQPSPAQQQPPAQQPQPPVQQQAPGAQPYQQPPAPQAWGGYQAQPAAPYQAAPPAPPRFVPQAAGPAAAGVAAEANTLPLALGAAGAVLALISTFLPWVSAFDEGSSLWELAEILDVLMVLLALGAAGAAAATFANTGSRALRVLTLGLMGGLLSFVLIPPLEFIASAEGEVSGTQAGEIVALLSAAALTAAVVMLILDLRPGLPAVPQGQAALLLLAGLGLLAFAGVAQPLVSLLPFESGVSSWESSEISDILTTLVALALAATAGAAIAGLATPQLVAAAFALGAYIGVGSLAGGIEALLAESNGIATFLTIFVVAPAALVGVVLVARGSELLSKGTAR